jgi:hypothetical protein
MSSIATACFGSLVLKLKNTKSVRYHSKPILNQSCTSLDFLPATMGYISKTHKSFLDFLRAKVAPQHDERTGHI